MYENWNHASFSLLQIPSCMYFNKKKKKKKNYCSATDPALWYMGARLYFMLPGTGSPKYRNGLFLRIGQSGVLFYEMEIFPPFCNFYSVFMISIISDCKNNIKYDFPVLESYFIYKGENLVPLLMWNQWRNGVLFHEMEHVFPIFATFILFLWFISYLTKKQY